MDTIDWEAFLKGWQGQPTTSPTSSSESELLTSSVESAGPTLSASSFKPSAKSAVKFMAEKAGLIGNECFYLCLPPENVMNLLDDDEENILLCDLVVGEEESLIITLGESEDDPPLAPKSGKDQQPDE